MSDKHKMTDDPDDVAPQLHGGMKRRDLLVSGSLLVAALALSAFGLTTTVLAQQRPTAQAQQQPAAPAPAARRPNILVIMGDDVRWFNIGAYHRGMMSGKTPNLDSSLLKA